MKHEHNESRRQLLQQSAVLGTGIILAGPASQRLFAQGYQPADPAKRVASKGYAARDTSGKLSPWTFERRPVGDEDILIEIKFSGICHSDINQLRGEWVLRNIRKFLDTKLQVWLLRQVKMLTGLRWVTMQASAVWWTACGTCESCKHGEEQHCDTGATLFPFGNPDPTS